jgi:hypothetical protein
VSFGNENNSTEEGIEKKIVLGSKAYYANQDLFKNKLLSIILSLKCTGHW